MKDSSIKEAPQQYFEIYKLAVEMADKISARRTTANTFFLTLNSAIILLYDKVNSVFLSLMGIILVLSWWLLLKSYRELNSAKFQVIQKMEDNLPASPFKDEWEILKRDPIEGWRKRYSELGQVERVVPFILGGIYLYLLSRNLDFSAIVNLLCRT